MQEGNVGIRRIMMMLYKKILLLVTYFCVYFSHFVISCVCSSVNSPCPSQASFPHPACRPSRGAPCCTCQTAGWVKTAAPPRPTGSTAALQHFTTSSPPRARRIGGSWTSQVPGTNKKFTFDSLKPAAEQLGPVLEDESALRYAVCHVCEDCLYSVKLWVCNFTITGRLKYSLLALISGSFLLSWDTELFKNQHHVNLFFLSLHVSLSR